MVLHNAVLECIFHYENMPRSAATDVGLRCLPIGLEFGSYFDNIFYLLTCFYFYSFILLLICNIYLAFKSLHTDFLTYLTI